MLRLPTPNHKEAKIFEKPCHVGIHHIALAEYSQVSTHMPGFQLFSGFLLHFVLVILATSSIRVETRTCYTSIFECRLYLGHMLTQLIKLPIDLFRSLLLNERLIWASHLMTIPGGGGALRYRGGPHPRYIFRGRRGLF